MLLFDISNKYSIPIQLIASRRQVESKGNMVQDMLTIGQQKNSVTMLSQKIINQ